jgi:hypothetical protein
MNITHDFDSSPDRHVESVIAKYKYRSRVGIKKYNTTLERNDLSISDWMQHLQEELMDAVLYLEKLKSEIKSK